MRAVQNKTQLVVDLLQKKLGAIGIKTVDVSRYAARWRVMEQHGELQQEGCDIVLSGFVEGKACFIIVEFCLAFSEELLFRIIGQIRNDNEQAKIACWYFFPDIDCDPVDQPVSSQTDFMISHYTAFRDSGFTLEIKVKRGVKFITDFLTKYGHALTLKFTRSVCVWLVPTNAAAVNELSGNGESRTELLRINRAVMDKFPSGFFAENQA